MGPKQGGLNPLCLEARRPNAIASGLFTQRRRCSNFDRDSSNNRPILSTRIQAQQNQQPAMMDGLNHALPVSGGTGAAVSGDFGESAVGS